MKRILLMNKGEQSEFTFDKESEMTLNSKSDSFDDHDDLITSDSGVIRSEALNASEIG